MNTTESHSRGVVPERQRSWPAPAPRLATGNAPRELLALWNEWNPVGADAATVPPDRYGPYVRPAMRMLEAHASERELARYVEWVVADRLGLGVEKASRVNAHAFATRMKRWYGPD